MRAAPAWVRLSLSALLLVSSGAAGAQEAPVPPVPGTILRIREPKRIRAEGKFVSLRSDSLVLDRVPGDAGFRIVKFSQIEKLDLLERMDRRKGAMRGAMWMGALGFVASGFNSADPVACRRSAVCSKSKWLVAGISTLEMGAIGAAVGAYQYPVKRWTPVDPTEWASRR